MWPPTSCVQLNAEGLTEDTPTFAEWGLINSAYLLSVVGIQRNNVHEGY